VHLHGLNSCWPASLFWTYRGATCSFVWLVGAVGSVGTVGLPMGVKELHGVWGCLM
jgi:hypothetical protein